MESGTSFQEIIPLSAAKVLNLSTLTSPNLGLLAQKFVKWKSGKQEKGGSSWSLAWDSKQYKQIIEKAQLSLPAQSLSYQKPASKRPPGALAESSTNPVLNEILKDYQKRYKKHFGECGRELRTYELQSRLAIGLGSADVREIGFMFHRHGFPYIPGSALKGAARAAAELIEKASVEEIRKVFGWAPDPKQGLSDAHIGKAVFWDAIPLPGQKLLELDVMNPHFPEYYRTEGKKSPSEWDSPIPLYFLAVPAGTKFLFAIEADSSVQTQALRWLDIALTQLGIGAKTTLGYGLWTRVS